MQEIVGIKNSQIEPRPFGVNVPIGLTYKSVNASQADAGSFAPKKKSGKKRQFRKKRRGLLPDRVLAGKVCVLGGA